MTLHTYECPMCHQKVQTVDKSAQVYHRCPSNKSKTTTFEGPNSE